MHTHKCYVNVCVDTIEYMALLKIPTQTRFVHPQPSFINEYTHSVSWLGVRQSSAGIYIYTKQIFKSIESLWDKYLP